MYISASIAAAILLTPVLGSLYPRDTYESIYARNLDARDAYYDAIYAREAGKSAGHHSSGAHPAGKHGSVGDTMSSTFSHAGQVTDGINAASNILGSGQSLLQQVQGFKSSFGNGADSNGADSNGADSNSADSNGAAADMEQRRSIYADPRINERGFDDDLYERDLEDLDERDLDDLYERDFEALDDRDVDYLYERDLERLDERDLDDLYERDIHDLYERGFEADLEDLYE
ncbi:hypothetical protein MMC26_004161 [Xylographa opegraphella]|nr:hypothetical protein [Xylographa opegraphella]